MGAAPGPFGRPHADVDVGPVVPPLAVAAAGAGLLDRPWPAPAAPTSTATPSAAPAMAAVCAAGAGIGHGMSRSATASCSLSCSKAGCRDEGMAASGKLSRLDIDTCDHTCDGNKQAHGMRCVTSFALLYTYMDLYMLIEPIIVHSD